MVVTESMVGGSSGISQLGLGNRNGKEDGKVKGVPEANGAVRH